jgi:GNAT superfamily N-acetyltransferase
MSIRYEWRGVFTNPELNRLHAEGFDHRGLDDDWVAQVDRHSLGWVTARDGDQLVGFVNVAWDGAIHAFILDTLVAVTHRRHGIATELVGVATDHARSAGCEWLHVDFDDELREFYFGACGFTPTNAGLIQL